MTHPPQRTHDKILIRSDVVQKPAVALETAVLTHGLPPGVNVSTMQEMMHQVRMQGAVPAAIGLLDGRLIIGMTLEQLQTLAQIPAEKKRKISARDLAPAMVQGYSGGTTVGATLSVCRRAGLKVFATGGIGGVHREPPYDVSGDLPQLAHSQVIVVCSGMKALLHVDATLEYLETLGIPVIGFQTIDRAFPVFYSAESPWKVPYEARSINEIIGIAREHWKFNRSAVLVVVPPPKKFALPYEEVEEWLRLALKEARRRNIRGQDVTPFLLQQMSELSKGRTLDVNRALLINNAHVAARIAFAWWATEQQRG